MDVRVISIGTLAAHPLWGEKAPARVGHSTCSLLELGSKRILVDPGLPERLIIAALADRANRKPGDITHVFLTSFNPEARRGLRAFDDATWWISSQEREAIGQALVAKLHEATEERDPAIRAALEQEVAILQKCEPAPDSLATHKGVRVDLFPMPGVTPGLAGLIVAGQRFTTLIAGDAVATSEHLEQGQVLTPCADVDRARESLAEAIEIADVIVPGRDNWCPNPTKRLF